MRFTLALSAVVLLAACGDNTPPPDTTTASPPAPRAMTTDAPSEARYDTLFAKAVGLPLSYSISANLGNLGNYTGSHDTLCLGARGHGYAREELDSLDRAGVDISCGKLAKKGTTSALVPRAARRSLASLFLPSVAHAQQTVTPPQEIGSSPDGSVKTYLLWNGPNPGDRHPRFVKLSLGNFLYDHRVTPPIPVWSVGAPSNFLTAHAYPADAHQALASAPIKFVVATPSIIRITGNQLICLKAGVGKFRANWTTASGSTVLTRDSTNIRCVLPPRALAPAQKSS